MPKQALLVVLLVTISMGAGPPIGAPGASAEPAASSPSDQRLLSLLFLLDASGSMQQNDPQAIRKAAAHALISLLAPEDEVAVVEFDAEGRILAAAPDTLWLQAAQQDRLSELVQKVGDRGQFTDFRAGLQEALEVFEGVPDTRRKVVLLLSDGILDPNPLDPAYTPHQYSYRMAIAGASRERLRKIHEEYQQRLSPIARRIISEEILPALRQRRVEIFTVALSPQADQSFLQSLAEETTRNSSEVHSFYAEKATDLVGIFTQLVQYWTDMMVLQSLEGTIEPGDVQEIFLDGFVQAPRVITLIDGEGEFLVYTEEGILEERGSDKHPGLKTYTIVKKTPPGRWTYGFRTGSGRYRTIWVGKSTIKILVSGLKPQYEFGEVVEAQVSLRIGDSDARPFLSPRTRVVAEFSQVEQQGGPVQQELTQDRQIYQLHYSPARAGLYTVKVIAYARDRQEREILPRPSLKYQFAVLPNFYVLPKRLNFGQARGGTTLKQEVEVHSGLNERVDITVTGKVTQSSSRSFQERKLDHLPTVHQTRFPIEPGGVHQETILLDLPKDVEWGDYEGEIQFRTSRGETYKVDFRVHIPSLWERLGLPLLLLLLLLLLVLGYFVYIWGYLGSPFGVLQPIAIPPGAPLLQDIKLSQVRRGVLSRWFNWRRNRLRIKNRAAEICLAHLPLDLQVELSFYRWGSAYIRNQSPKDSEHRISIEEPGVGTFERGPGQSLSLKHQSVITIDGYKFRFEK